MSITKFTIEKIYEKKRNNSNDDINCFWHETDKMTLTSIGIPWCYPNTYMGKGITVEYDYRPIPNIYGICTDYCLKWRTMWK